VHELALPGITEENVAQAAGNDAAIMETKLRKDAVLCVSIF